MRDSKELKGGHKEVVHRISVLSGYWRTQLVVMESAQCNIKSLLYYSLGHKIVKH